MNFQGLTKHYRTVIDRELANFFDERIKRVRGMNRTAVESLQVLREFSLRESKRIRPMLTIFSYKGFGGKNEKEIVQAALAVELMQSFLLIHDDIIDEDEIRRGYLTVHKIFEGKSGKRQGMKDHKHYGESVAIVVGDIAACLGSEAILSTGFGAKRRISAADKFNRVIVNTCFGQIIDIDSEAKHDVSEKDVHDIHTLKTAIYTIEGPLHIGAILAGATEKNLKQLSEFAIPLGRAFQIRDDILGMFGTRERIGKPIGSDIREGKRTLLTVKALQKCPKKDRDFLLKHLGDKNLTGGQFDKIRKIVRQSGSLDYSIRLMEHNVKSAKKILGSMQMKKAGKDFLNDIADYIAQREK
jgi:geranylgeranyl diphosphate synthase type I